MFQIRSREGRRLPRRGMKSRWRYFHNLANQTRSVLPCPTNTNLIPMIWKFLVKFCDGMEIAKACLVAFGCADKNEYQITDTYAPVCRVECVRHTLSLASRMNLKLVTLDVTTAFLYSEINDVIHISTPDGLQLNRKRYALK